ncbi:hypothetical protein [Staphylococcus equorum]|uniref:hypothetical protein n=1 Tax=Staphylococcus equorum TaxID=246432 RepID=UPI003CE8AD1B
MADVHFLGTDEFKQLHKEYEAAIGTGLSTILLASYDRKEIRKMMKHAIETRTPLDPEDDGNILYQ